MLDFVILILDSLFSFFKIMLPLALYKYDVPSRVEINVFKSLSVLMDVIIEVKRLSLNNMILMARINRRY